MIIWSKPATGETERVLVQSIRELREFNEILPSQDSKRVQGQASRVNTVEGSRHFAGFFLDQTRKQGQDEEGDY